MNLDDDDTVDELPARPRKVIPPADRGLLELAGRAIGAVHVEDVDGENWVNLHFADGSTIYHWNPLLHGDDAFNLAVDIDLDVFQAVTYREAQVAGALQSTIFEPWGGDKRAATRRAIVRAAAEIGKQRS